MESKNKLKCGLSICYICFMVLGLVIGIGLFYGLVDVIKMVGLSVLLVYIIGGIVVYIIMCVLGEMLVYNLVVSFFLCYV